MPTLRDALWASAIAERLSDEWGGKEDFPEDAELLRQVLRDLFLQSPTACHRLIGTGVIEEDYFEPLN